VSDVKAQEVEAFCEVDDAGFLESLAPSHGN
jgi:hypothetical protein